MITAKRVCGFVAAAIMLSALGGRALERRPPGPPSSSKAPSFRDLGPVDPSIQVSFSAVLRLKETALHTFLAKLEDPSSSSFHRYISPRAFGRRFGLKPNAIQRAASTLRTYGFQVDTGGDPERTSIRLTGSAGSLRDAFGVTLRLYSDAEGNVFHAPAHDALIPDSLAGSIVGLSGLSDRPPTPEVAQASGATAGPLLPIDIAKAYDIQPLWDAGYRGEHQTVAVVSYSGFNREDVDTFDKDAGISGAPKVLSVSVLGGNTTTPNAAGVEDALDIEAIRAISPQAQIINFVGGREATFGDIVKAIVNDGRAQIATISYGGCDLGDNPMSYGSQARAADEAEFEAAAAAGVAIFVSSGDNGAYTCQRWKLSDTRLSTSWPSDSPFVTSVGGTRLTRSSQGSYLSESGWQNILSGLGGGGGLDPFDTIAAWQVGPGVQNTYSDGHRQVPDVSGPADWASVGSEFFTIYKGRESPGSGTSQASPFWAGCMALVRQYAQAQGIRGLGPVNTMLYQLAATPQGYPAFHDVTLGGNRYYPATEGWDFATGLGSPDVWNLARDAAAYLRIHPPPTS